MIDVKQAVQIARDYMRTLYSEDEIPNLLLEEVQRTGDDQYWLITFGFDTNQIPDDKAPSVTLAWPKLMRPKYLRAYRTIKIRADTGESVEMFSIRGV